MFPQSIKPILLAACVFVMLASGCARRSLHALAKKDVVVTRSSTILAPLAGEDSAQLQYTGCGGFYIRYHGIALMIDPFFSHQRFLRIGRSILFGSRIKPSRSQLAWGKKMMLDSLQLTEAQMQQEVKGIFSAHGHYDHFMDVPFIQHEWLNEHAPVFANTSSTVVSTKIIRPEKIHDIQKIASVREQRGDSVIFSNNHSNIRVYPIFADHNPHSHNIKLFSGSAIQPSPHLNAYDDKTTVNDWLEGQTLSFLIDFVKSDTIVFRVFLQSSSCQFPNGIPPTSLLQEKEVDLAILGIASYQFSENSYPCDFISALGPKHLMFVHWEDFFRRYQQPLKAVKTNNIPRFFSDVFAKCHRAYLLPVPGSVITIRTTSPSFRR